MVTNNTYEYGIKYKAVKINQDEYLMIPISLEGGLSDGFEFSTDTVALPIANEKEDFKNKYVIDNVYTTEDLEEMYDYGDDTDFLSNYFFDEYKNVIYLVKVSKDGTLNKYAVNLDHFEKREYDMTYHIDKSVPVITLNEDALNEILDNDDIAEVRVILNKYKQLLKSFGDYNKKTGVTKISVVNGKVNEVETDKKVVDTENLPKKETKNVISYGGVDVTYNGLSKYLKERIFGHDEVLDTFAQKLYMNYTAADGERVESILLVGPTGTGKTETVKVASEYLCLPFVEANAADLVTQGIKGTSIGDLLKELVEKTGGDIKKAQRGIVFLDEFDKFSDSDLDIKKSVRGILLSFTGGSINKVEDDNFSFSFDSKMTNKIFGGVFDRINNKTRALGFGAVPINDKLGTSDEIRKMIIDKKYYTQEELSRIHNILGFDELSRETKKNILLYSKLSELSKKKERYKRQFGIDIVVGDEYIDALLDNISNSEIGMRNLNNFVMRTIDDAEKEILRNENKGYKRLILTKDTVSDSHKFDLV